VAVQPLTDIAIEGDEVSGAEDKMIFGDADAVGFGHGRFPEKE
jgi:hypothetical protein